MSSRRAIPKRKPTGEQRAGIRETADRRRLDGIERLRRRTGLPLDRYPKDDVTEAARRLVNGTHPARPQEPT